MSDGERMPYETVKALCMRYLRFLRALGFTQEHIAEQLGGKFEEYGFTLDDAMQVAAYHALHNPDPAARAEAAQLLTRAFERGVR